MVRGARGLGRGLEALLSSEETKFTVQEIQVDQIKPRPDQPRQNFPQSSLDELAESIRQHGVLQPILVRPNAGAYQIVAGERRWRAAQIAKLESVPVVVKEMKDYEAAEISLVENLQRLDLNAVEEARALARLMEEFGYTQEQISVRVGKSRSHVANTVRILALPDQILQMIERGLISAGHARALVGMDIKEQLRLARQIAGEGLSVREIEDKVRNIKPANREIEAMRVEYRDVEERLQNHFGTKVRIKAKKKGGILEIPYFDEEDFERILETLGINLEG